MKAAYCSHKSGEPEVLYIHPGRIRTLQTSSKMRAVETVLVGKLLMPIPEASVYRIVLQQYSGPCTGFGYFTYMLWSNTAWAQRSVLLGAGFTRWLRTASEAVLPYPGAVSGLASD